jgi:hypothetical protein
VYRINRLYDLLSHGDYFNRVVPHTSFRLQLYIDAHLPLAHSIERGESITESAFQPFLCFDELLSSHIPDITEAFVHSIPDDDARRTNKRSKSLWEVFRRVLLRGVHQSMEGKQKTFKTISADFSEVLQREDGRYISEIVMCTLLGNYTEAAERPSWSARLALYEKYTHGTPEWLAKCDYLVYYSICECMHASCIRVPSLVLAIESHPELHAQWVSTTTMARTIVDRVRSSLRDCPSMVCMTDLNEMLKNRHVRMSKSVDVATGHQHCTISGAIALLRESSKRRTHGAWKTHHCADVLHAMLTRRLDIRLEEIAPAFLSPETCALLETTAETNAEKLADCVFKQCNDEESMTIKDILKAVYIQRSTRTFRMPDSYTTQLLDTLYGDSFRLTRESLERRCTLYICTDCVTVSNTIVSSKDKDVALRQQLKYAKSIRICISDDTDTVTRVCDACSLKRNCDARFPLLEIPLLHLGESPHCFGAVVFDQCVVMCPACSLCIERTDLRFSSDSTKDGWACCFCNPL